MHAWATPAAESPPGEGASEAGAVSLGDDDDCVTFRKDLRVAGDVHVDGVVYGKLATPPHAADYAEWFAWSRDALPPPDGGGKVAPAPPALAAPPPGSVVQLRSPEQRLTLDTSGDGPCMIVSTSPSVAAGMPVDRAVAARGAFVAFLGQVPVRVRGGVDCGDALVPSGAGDGVAVAARAPGTSKVAGAVRGRRGARPREAARHRPDLDALGVAMEPSPSDGEHTIHAFVRWNHAVRRESPRREHLPTDSCSS